MFAFPILPTKVGMEIFESRDPTSFLLPLAQELRLTASLQLLSLISCLPISSFFSASPHFLYGIDE